MIKQIRSVPVKSLNIGLVLATQLFHLDCALRKINSAWCGIQRITVQYKHACKHSFPSAANWQRTVQFKTWKVQFKSWKVQFMSWVLLDRMFVCSDAAAPAVSVSYLLLDLFVLGVIFVLESFRGLLLLFKLLSSDRAEERNTADNPASCTVMQ